MNTEESNYYCLICDSPLQEFASYGEPLRPGKCTNCQAKPRNRAMGYFLKEWAAPHWTSTTRVLEIGASKITTQRILSHSFVGDASFNVVDIRKLKHHESLNSPHKFQQMDASKMNWEDHTFDHIFCNYVLQDAPQPFEVIKEIHRCLKKEGWGMINVAFLKETTEKVSIPEEKSEEFQDYLDSNGLYYHFGPDFLNILNDLGFHSILVKPFSDFPENWLTQNSIKKNQEFILVAHEKSVLTQLQQSLSKINIS